MAYLLDTGGHQLYDSANFRLLDSEGLSLITDRTAADVQRVLDLLARQMDPEEKLTWLDGMKGAYNYTDLNRVEYFVGLVSERMKLVGWNLQPVIKLDWSISDLPTASDMRRYLNNIRLLRSALPAGIPDAPSDMDNFTYTEANTIELILEMLDAAVVNIMANVCYCGEVFSGEV